MAAGHSSATALIRHFLAAFALCSGERHGRQHTRHRWDRAQDQRQRKHPDFEDELQQAQSTPVGILDAMSAKGFQVPGCKSEKPSRWPERALKQTS